MHRSRPFAAIAALTAAIALSGTAFAYGSTAHSASPHQTRSARPVVPAGTGTRAVCPRSSNPDIARCLAIGVTVAPGSSRFLTTKVQVNGLGPAEIQDAYKLPATGGDGRVVALIEAGDYTHIDSDLATWRKNFGLPACTEANGCLTVVNEHGGSDLPHPRNGWSIETALDVDSVSAACPTCHILVVEAKDAHKKNLAIGNATAARLGAVAASNSWKVPEFEGQETKKWTHYFSAPGVAFTASSGDGGGGSGITIGYPSGEPDVLSIGGTLLTKADNQRGWSESVWSGAGSSCGVYVAKPSWQKDKGCKMRSTSDVSADASPASGLAVYHTNRNGTGGWSVYGGTSLSAPLIAAIYGLAGNTGQLGDGIAAYLYKHEKNLYDVTQGSNGTCPKQWEYICNAGPGYDGPTGLGTPHGLAAF